ncbi:Hypothetical_protein [Hexamita inflata]|uniref:Hypothetical_protein n=1 Tax=Hexamita inflata TaxID=28002 RepID=A0AA86UMP5_9EUKA|nr:Hypothetical protein HINF_LOCUS49034 [Hexamita inflata]
MINKNTIAFLSNQKSRTALSHVKPPHRLSVSSFGLIQLGSQLRQLSRFLKTPKKTYICFRTSSMFQTSQRLLIFQVSHLGVVYICTCLYDQYQVRLNLTNW